MKDQRQMRLFGSWMGLACWVFLFALASNCGGNPVDPKKESGKTSDGGVNKDGAGTEGSSEQTPKEGVDGGGSEKAPDGVGHVDNKPVDQAPAPDKGSKDTPAVETKVESSGPEQIVPDSPPGTGSFKLTKFILKKGANDGFDLDGDNNKDNQMGKIFNSKSFQLKLAATVLQNNIDNQIDNEQLILLMTLTDMTDPTGQSGTATLNIFLGQKGDNKGEYKIDPKSYDSFGQPWARYQNTPIKNGVGETKLADIILYIPLIIGQPASRIELKKTKLRFTVAPQFRRLDAGTIGGALPVRYLDFDSGLGGTVLDILLKEDPVAGQPDIDVDGDGKEALSRANNAIVCKDGDQKTDVQSPSPCPDKKAKCTCVQNQAMADGFSLVLDFSAVSTTIVK